MSLKYYDVWFKEEFGEDILSDSRDWTFEAMVVAFADEIAQRHHDLEDGIFAGLINIEHLCSYFNDNFSMYGVELNPINGDSFLGVAAKTIINFYVNQTIDTFRKRMSELENELKKNKGNGFNITREYYWNNREEAYDLLTKGEKAIINSVEYDEEFADKDKRFQKYLSNHILQSEVAQKMDGKASFVIRKLVKAYLTNPQQLPDKTIITIIKHIKPEVLENGDDGSTVSSRARTELKKQLQDLTVEKKYIILRVICDFIAGMTDNYALSQYQELYGELKEYNLFFS